VEHRGSALHGFVQFFGAFQLFGRLSSTTTREGTHALMAWIDPIEFTEYFELAEPVGLGQPPPFYGGYEFMQHEVRPIQKLIDGACRRGAVVRPEVRVRISVPRF
jgi:hypothetical protein